MNFQKTTKVAIFIDYENFTNGYEEFYKTRVDDNLWNKLSDELLNYYRDNFIKNDFEVVEHTGTWLCVGMSDTPSGEEKCRRDTIFRPLDRKTGFILRYGFRTPRQDENGQWVLGPEKGVDGEIICQMLMGAFLNHYDACIVLSDDADYVPAARRVQEYFGKKVIQAGFLDGRLRGEAFAHIPFERPEMNLEKLAMRVVSDILFELDKAILDKVAMTQLDFIVKKLKKDPEVSITIHGHTDNTGTEEENLKLSKERAAAVAEHIVAKGIPPERVSHKGHGQTKPVAPNTTEEGRQKNRRVEFEIDKSTKHQHE